jgi:hypothetical protein
MIQPVGVLLFVVIALLAVSCNGEVAKGSQEVRQPQPSSIGVRPVLDEASGPTCAWDTGGFGRMVDSLMSIAHHRQLSFTAVAWAPVSGPGATIRAHASEVTAIQYRDPRRQSNAHIWLMMACFGNDSSAMACFHSLEKLSAEDGVPGLTYTNDDVRFLNGRMVWINSTCQLSIPNHRKLAGLLMERLHLGEAVRRIECNCGGFCRTVQ